MKFKYHRWFQALVVPLVALAFHIFFGYRVIGRENIPEGGCVVCPNHVQLSDPPFAAVALGGKTPLRLMAKKELFRKKIFAWLIAALGAFRSTVRARISLPSRPHSARSVPVRS